LTGFEARIGSADLRDEEHEPDRLRFEEIVNGNAFRVYLSGIEFRRVET
jgi:hypothetical protein